MADSIPVTLIIGCLLGFLAGLGTGGGSLLILWLTYVLEIDTGTARMITLLFFLPSAVIACLFRWRQGKLQWKIILPGTLCGCASAGLVTLLTGHMETSLIQKLYGVMLLAIGIKELFYRERKAK